MFEVVANAGDRAPLGDMAVESAAPDRVDRSAGVVAEGPGAGGGIGARRGQQRD